MRTNSLMGIIALALLGVGCAGPLSFSHRVAYQGHDATIEGSSNEPPSVTIRAAGSVRATTVVAEAEATRIVARAGISRAHAELIVALTPAFVACMTGDPRSSADDRSFEICVGRFPTLQTLLAEDPGLGSYFGGGGIGTGPGAYFPNFETGPASAYADTVSGQSSVGSADVGRRLDRVERETAEAVGMFHDYTVAGSTEGGVR